MDNHPENKIEFIKREKIKSMKKILSLLVVLLYTLALPAQGISAETMNSEGKINVVIAVMLTILLGIILYLIRLDNKISKMEKNK